MNEWCEKLGVIYLVRSQNYPKNNISYPLMRTRICLANCCLHLMPDQTLSHWKQKKKMYSFVEPQDFKFWTCFGRPDMLFSFYLCICRQISYWHTFCENQLVHSVSFELFLVKTFREEINAEKRPAEQKHAELKNANLVQNSYSFISNFLNHSHHSHSLIPHFSGILDHSQSFIPRFLNSRLHFFQCVFHNFKKIWHSVKLLHTMKPTGNEKKKNTHLVFFSQS